MSAESIAQINVLPLIIDLNEIKTSDFIQYFVENKLEIDRKLANSGAIKFNGVQIDSLNDFQEVVNGISDDFLSYIDGNSPRTKLTGNVYTSTEYDQTQKITMHNELSYSAKWPGRIYFSCLETAETGGETLLVDGREILKVMNPDILNEIRKKGITYIRNLHGGVGVGPSWQDTFETKDKNELEAYCKAYHLDYKWCESGNLKLIQQSKGIIHHPLTQEEVWFNQIDQFHPSHLGEEIYEVMQDLYEQPADFPMFVQFGDGTQIAESMIQEISNTIDKITVAPKWRKNEFLLVDNILVCHGRNWYTGDRRVLVSMSK